MAEIYHRRPKAGARPFVILRRFGPISFVYELDDTEGKEMPQEVISKYILHPFHSNTLIDGASFKILSNLCSRRALVIWKKTMVHITVANTMECCQCCQTLTYLER